jgi:hypothetical protein
VPEIIGLFLFPADRIDRTDFVAGPALDAGVHVNYIDWISGTDGGNRTNGFAGSAGNTVFCDEMGTHDLLLFACFDSSREILPLFLENSGLTKDFFVSH